MLMPGMEKLFGLLHRLHARSRAHTRYAERAHGVCKTGRAFHVPTAKDTAEKAGIECVSRAGPVDGRDSEAGRPYFTLVREEVTACLPQFQGDSSDTFVSERKSNLFRLAPACNLLSLGQARHEVVEMLQARSE